MVPGGGELKFNIYNSINNCHSEEQFSVLESPSHALSDDIFGGLKLESLCDVIKYDVTI